MPSRPILQACRNTLSPSWARCSFRRSPEEAPAQQARERRLARLQRLAPQVLAVQFEEVESVYGRCRPPDAPVLHAAWPRPQKHPPCSGLERAGVPETVLLLEGRNLTLVATIYRLTQTQ